jgi:hypothetical protein
MNSNDITAATAARIRIETLCDNIIDIAAAEAFYTIHKEDRIILRDYAGASVDMKVQRITDSGIQCVCVGLCPYRIIDGEVDISHNITSIFLPLGEERQFASSDTLGATIWKIQVEGIVYNSHATVHERSLNGNRESI